MSLFARVTWGGVVPRAFHVCAPPPSPWPHPCVCARAHARTCCRAGAVCPQAGGPVSVQEAVPWRVGRGGSVWPPRPGLWACHSLRAAEDADVHPTHFQLDDFCSCRKVSRNVPELTVFRTRSLACLCPPGVVGCVYLLSDSSTVWLSRWSLPSVQASHLRQGGASP